MQAIQKNEVESCSQCLYDLASEVTHLQLYSMDGTSTDSKGWRGTTFPEVRITGSYLGSCLPRILTS